MRSEKVLRFASLLLTMPLAACLFSEAPYFDASNSVDIAESPEVAAANAAYAGYRAIGRPPDEPLISSSAEQALRVIALTPSFIVLQAAQRECQEPPCAAYFAFKRPSGRPPEACFVRTDFSGTLEAAASRFGVAVETIVYPDKEPLPPDMRVVGPPDKARAFIINRFTNGPVFCKDDLWKPKKSG